MSTNDRTERAEVSTFAENFDQLMKLPADQVMRFFFDGIKTYPNLLPILQGAINALTRKTSLDIVKSFPIFIPRSAGNYSQKSELTIQTINQVFPFLCSLVHSLGLVRAKISNIETFPKSAAEKNAALEIKPILDRFGSDKANFHNYHYIYGPILHRRLEIRAVLEIGMGTNNTDVVSNMGERGQPGASLRAFREFLPNARIFGADIDHRILFTEDRIDSFFVDQTKPESFQSLGMATPDDFDLIIDDGLHSPDANIATLQFALAKIKVGGWVVVEDIGLDATPVFEVIASLLPSQFEAHILEASGSVIVFAVQRLS